MKWNKNTKEIISYIFALIAFIFGIGISIWGFATEPKGEVHNSVLWMLGQALTFTAAIIGVSFHIKNEIAIAKEELKKQLQSDKEKE